MSYITKFMERLDKISYHLSHPPEFLRVNQHSVQMQSRRNVNRVCSGKPTGRPPAVVPRARNG